jgi:hypothetical protein
MKLFVASLLALATMATPVLRVDIGEESFCFTEEQTNLMKFFKEMKENTAENETGKCDGEDVDVVSLPLKALPTTDTTIVDLESLKRAFHFTELTAHSNHEFPMPMMKDFEEAKILIGEDQIDIPADIQNFFKYTVVAKETDAEQEQAIKEEDSNDKAHAAVSGKYGSLNIPNYGINSLFLNPKGSQYDAKTVNNPRELIKLMKAAQYLNYDVLLKYASMKLATLIKNNTVNRIRALLGFSPNGDYTEHSYTNGDGDVVTGITELKEESPWFDMDNDSNAKFVDVIPAYKKENVKYAEITEELRNEAPKKIQKLKNESSKKKEEKVKTNKMLPGRE